MDDDSPVSRREHERDMARLEALINKSDERLSGTMRDMVPVDAFNRSIGDLQKDLSESEARQDRAHSDIRAEMDRRVREVERRLSEKLVDVRRWAEGMFSSITTKSQWTRSQITTILLGIGGIGAALLAAIISARGIK